MPGRIILQGRVDVKPPTRLENERKKKTHVAPPLLCFAVHHVLENIAYRSVLRKRGLEACR